MPVRLPCCQPRVRTYSYRFRINIVLLRRSILQVPILRKSRRYRTARVEVPDLCLFDFPAVSPGGARTITDSKKT